MVGPDGGTPPTQAKVNASIKDAKGCVACGMVKQANVSVPICISDMMTKEFGLEDPEDQFTCGNGNFRNYTNFFIPNMMQIDLEIRFVT